MRKRLALVMVILGGLLGAACGGGGGGGASGAGVSSGSVNTVPGGAPTTQTAGARGLAVSVRVLNPAQRGPILKAAELQSVLIDVLDPNTLQMIIPTTTVTRDSSNAAPKIDLDVPVGNWILRVQGRAADGTAAGTRFQQLVVVTEGVTTGITADLNPVPNLASIQVNPGPTALVASGTSVQFTATAVLTDLTTQDISGQVSWASSNAAVANISSGGLASGLSLGNSVITASVSNLSGGSNLTVTPANLTSLQVTPAALNLAPGVSAQLTATGIFADKTHQDLTGQVKWTSSSTAANVSATGNVTGNFNGSAVITASLAGVNATANVSVGRQLSSIAVTPANPSLAVGQTQQLKATGSFSDNTTQDLTATVTWASNDSSVANVSSSGLVTSLGQGTTQVTASSANVTGRATIVVPAAQLTSLTVTPASTSVPQGSMATFKVTGTFSDQSTRDLTPQVTWSSTDNSVLSISNGAGTQGVATGVAPGKVVVEATKDAVSASARVTVTGSTLTILTVKPANPTLNLGEAVQFQALATFNDGTTVDFTTNVTWTSTVGSISNSAGTQGLFTAVTAGSGSLTAATSSLSASTPLTVLPVSAPPLPPPPVASPSAAPAASPLGILYVADQGAAQIKAYVAPQFLSGLVVPDYTTAPGEVNSPIGVALDPGRDILYVADSGSTAVLTFQPASQLGQSGVTRRALTFGVAGIQSVTVDPSSDTLYADDGSNLYALAGASTQPTGVVTPSFGLKRSFQGLAFDSVNARLFSVASGGPINYYNGATTSLAQAHSLLDVPGVALGLDRVDQILFVGSGSHANAFDAPGHPSYAGDNSGGNQRPTMTIQVSGTVGGITVDEARSWVYVADTPSQQVGVYSLVGLLPRVLGKAGGGPPAFNFLTGMTAPKGVVYDSTHGAFP